MTSPLGEPFEVLCDNVTVSHPGESVDRNILNGVDLTIAPGQFVAVIGGNGAGKSTLLKAVAGEVDLAEGSIRVGGQPISGPVNRRIDRVGIVHQQDDADLLLHFSIAMNIAFRQTNNDCHPHTFWACNARYRREVSTELAARVRGWRLDVTTAVGRLSQGERQMLNVVIATHFEHLQRPCRLLLLDEHTSGLSHTKAEEVMKFTAMQIRDTKTTALMVTHRYQDAVTYADRILVLGGGKIRDDLKTGADTTVDKLRAAVEAAGG